MELEEVLLALHEPESLEVLSPHWQDSQDCFPADLPDFLNPDQIRACREWDVFGSDVEPTLLEAASRIANSEPLRRLAWHGYRLTFESDYGGYSNFRSWPKLERSLGDLSGVFYLLLCLAAIPLIRRTHTDRSIPEEITRATTVDCCIGAHRYKVISGRKLGMESFMLVWLRLVGSGDLHRLGRMQYVVRPFRGRLRAFRKSDTGATIALSQPDVGFDEEGQVIRGEEEPAWTSRLVEDDGSVTGTPISPAGHAVLEEVTLALEEWTLVLAPQDPVLEMHIPEGDPMTPEACEDSMRQAFEFFPRYYPNKPFKSIACYSWILNTQLQEMLPRESNLPTYQRELYLFPVPYGGRDGLYFIFYDHDIDERTAPRDTTLKRAYVDHLLAGKPLRNGGMFFLPEDMDKFGTQPYQKTGWTT